MVPKEFSAAAKTLLVEGGVVVSNDLPNGLNTLLEVAGCVVASVGLPNVLNTLLGAGGCEVLGVPKRVLDDRGCDIEDVPNILLVGACAVDGVPKMLLFEDCVFGSDDLVNALTMPLESGACETAGVPNILVDNGSEGAGMLGAPLEVVACAGAVGGSLKLLKTLLETGGSKSPGVPNILLFASGCAVLDGLLGDANMLVGRGV